MKKNYHRKGGFNNNFKPKDSSQIKRKNLEDYVYQIGTHRIASEFSTITKYVINHIRKTYTDGDDIANALEERKEPDFDKWMPTMNPDYDEDNKMKKASNRGYLLLFEAEIKAHVERKERYRSNEGNAYALIFGQCNKALQNKIQSRNNFESIKKNPILLLKAIEEHSICFQENKYPLSIVLDALKSMINLRQREKESLIDYLARFKSAKDVLAAQMGGPIVLKKYMTTEGIPSEKEAFENLMALLLLENADKTKYGTLITGLSTQFSLNNDQYPKTIIEMNNVMANHRFDKKVNASGSYNNNTNNNDQKEKDNGKDDAPELSFAQLEGGKCFCCGKSGHKSPQCRHNGKPKAEWVINKLKDNGKDVSDKKDDSEKKKVSWMCTQISLAQSPGEYMKDHLLLDSQSTIDLICNKKFVTDIYKVKTPLLLSTNAGTMQITLKAILPGYGEVYFCEDAMTNVISMANMEDKYRITYDSERESALIVHTECGKIKFTRNSNNLYAKQLKYDTANATCLVETVEENASHYTGRQMDRAKAARNLMHSLGYPSTADLKNIIKMNSIQNCPITVQDVDVAEKIFGKDVGSLKGKTSRSKPTPVVHDIVEIPPELKEAQRDIDLCFDIMFVNGWPFLVSVSKRLKYRTVELISSRKMDECKQKLNNIIKIYHNAGFKIQTISCDNEFKPLRSFMLDHGITPNFSSAQEHVPEAERNIRVIKERIRAVYHDLPFDSISRIMLKYLAMESARKLNYFPPKDGVSSYYSPREILHGIKLDYQKHCTIPLFAYVQAHDEPEPRNSQHARTIDCIYLRPLANAQGGHELLNLVSGRVITRRKVTVIPMTRRIIELVEDMAQTDGMKGLQLRTKSGQRLFESDRLAGVNTLNENDDEAAEESDNDETQLTGVPDINEVQEILGDYSSQSESTSIENDNTCEIADENDMDDDDNTSEVADENDMDDESSNPDTELDETEFVDALDEMNNNTNAGVQSTRTRSNIRPPERLIAQMYQKDTDNHYNYTGEMEARMLATIMLQIEQRMDIQEVKTGTQHVLTYSLKQGIKKFGKNGRIAAINEMKQLYDRKCFIPINKNELSDLERKRALESLIFLTEKRDGRIKARHCANGSSQRDYLSKEDVSSPTVSTEATLLTAVIDAEEKRDVATCDIPNAFIQTDLDETNERIIMKIRGVLVDILCEMDDKYKDYIILENGRRVVYVHILKAIYGLLVSAMLFYRKLSNSLIEDGYVINPYDICVANKMVNGKQHTVTWHVDDLKSSHVDPEVNNEFIKSMKKKFGKIGNFKVTRGKYHDYLGMGLDYSIDGQVSIDMVDYVRSMVSNFPESLEGRNVASPWNDDLFKVDNDSKPLNDEKKKKFHTITAQGLFLCKRGRPDIAPAIAYLTTRVQNPNESDWCKLKRMIKYLDQTANDRLTLKSDRSRILKWHVDAAFAVHHDFRSHTGGMLTMGKGAITSISRKQGTNTRSSTESEIVAADDIIGPMLWTRLFLEAQGYGIQDNIMYQDNQSAMKMEMNGKRSAGKRSRHLNIRLFYVTDQHEKKNISIVFCPTDQMTADYLTKPLHGEKFKKFRQEMMNLPMAAQLVMWHCMNIT